MTDKTLPPSDDPTRGSFEVVMRELSNVAAQNKGLENKMDAVLRDVRELTKIARNCFEHVVKQEVRLQHVEERQESADARMKVLEDRVRMLERPNA